MGEEILLTKKGNIRKRKPKKSNVYFTQETEDAIIAYLNSSNEKERNVIFNDKIYYAFFKLSENIIHTFKFYYTEVDTIPDLQHEVIVFLLEKLHLFNHSKNLNDKLNKIINIEFGENYKVGSFTEYTNSSPTVSLHQLHHFISNLDVSDECKKRLYTLTPPKAYSYFGTIVKRYLILYNNNNYKKLKDKTDIDAVDEDKSILIDLINNHNIDETPSFLQHFIKYINLNLFTLFPKAKDARIADAIIELFKRSENIDIFNKKALYIYIKEITDASTPQITKIIKRLKIAYIKKYNEYYEHGYVNMKS